MEVSTYCHLSSASLYFAVQPACSNAASVIFALELFLIPTSLRFKSHGHKVFEIYTSIENLQIEQIK